MAKNLAYKRQEIVTLKAIGLLDVDNMTIGIDGEEKSIKTLFKDFNATDVELTLKVKNDIELEEPEETLDETSDNE